MQIPDLTLPSGGVVKFRNDDELTRADYVRVRSLVGKLEGRGEAGLLLAEGAAATLISSWVLPPFPPENPPPLPFFRTDGSVDTAGMAGMSMRDAIALDVALTPFATWVVVGARPELPKEPATDSA